jgi:chaperonin cofactor prefoldin
MDQRVEAAVREYHIIIDSEARTILHDCADWSKALQAKRFCKQVGKLLLSMDREKATKMLEKIYSQKEKWQFKPYT